ncbi:MAG: membrane protein insertase YidC [Acidimicrobiales bacterium]
MSSLTRDIGRIFQPFLKFVADVLAFFYSLVPNYPVDVALLTLVIMAVLTPLTVKGTKNMAAMQALGPEMKKLQQKYKGAENRVQLNEEMMKLYREHNVNPASGCLPMLLQMPAFLVLYEVVRGITNTVTITHERVNGQLVQIPKKVIAAPRYVSPTSKMYKDIIAAHGRLSAFGMDWAKTLFGHHSSLFMAIPYLVLVLASVGLQYLQMSRMNSRNPQAAQANPQAAALQKYMPLIFGFIYINIAAIINVYFVFSSAVRIITQEILYRRGVIPGGAASTAVATTAAVVPGTTQGGKRRAPAKATPAPANTKPASEKARPAGAGGRDAGRAGSGKQATGRSAGDEASRGRTGAKRGTGGHSGAPGQTAPGRRPTQGGKATNPSSSGAVANGEDRGSMAEASGTSPQPAGTTHPRSKDKRARRAR